MNTKLNQYFANIIVILLATVLIASGCGPAAISSPTIMPPTPIPPTSTPIPPTPTPDLIDLVKAYEEALNRHDSEGVMAVFDDEATYQWGGWTTAIIKQEIIDLHNYFIEVKEEVQNTDCTVEGSVVKCQAVFHDDCTAAAGMDGERYSSVEYIFENGKIHKVTAIEYGDDFITLNGFYIRMLNWGSKNYQEEYEKLLNSSGVFMWDQETGNIMSKFCQEFVDTKP